MRGALGWERRTNLRTTNKARSHTQTQAQATQPLHRGPPTPIPTAIQQLRQSACLVVPLSCIAVCVRCSFLFLYIDGSSLWSWARRDACGLLEGRRALWGGEGMYPPRKGALRWRAVPPQDVVRKTHGGVQGLLASRLRSLLRKAMHPPNYRLLCRRRRIKSQSCCQGRRRTLSC